MNICKRAGHGLSRKNAKKTLKAKGLRDDIPSMRRPGSGCAGHNQPRQRQIGFIVYY
jgi:hypothetical protein